MRSIFDLFITYRMEFAKRIDTETWKRCYLKRIADGEVEGMVVLETIYIEET